MEFTLENKIVCLFGKRNSGKSHLLKYLVDTELYLFNKVFIFSPTEKVNQFYQHAKITHEDCIFDNYNNDWVMKLIEKMTERKMNKKNNYNVLLILDDCISDYNFHQSPSLNILATRGRHLNISLIITCQYIFSVPPIFRTNCDYIFAGQMNKRSMDLLYDEFGTTDKSEFMEIIKNCTKDYYFLIINCNSVKDTSNLNAIYGKIKVPEINL